MSKYIDNRSATTSGYIYAATNALHNSLVRMRYYEDTNESRFLEESKEWIDVANLYMKEILNEKTVEIQSINFGSGMF